MGMRPSSAHMCGSKAVNKTIGNCIAKTSNGGCSKVRLQAIHPLHEYPPAKLAGPWLSASGGLIPRSLLRGNSFGRS